MNRIQLVHGQTSKAGEAYTDLTNKFGNLKGMTIVISGASRGIGLGMGVKAAKDGANIVILAKTTTPHKKMAGTIYTAAAEIAAAGGQCLPMQCDIRFEDSVKACIDAAVAKFGGIDILINNASSLNLSDTNDLSIKKFDLMNQINFRGSFVLAKLCLPYLKKSANPHILSISPPINMRNLWFEQHTGYTIVKYGATMMSWGMSLEFMQFGIAVNTLWPVTTIATAAVEFELGGATMLQTSRTVDIMGDAAYEILTSKSTAVTGNFFADEEVLKMVGVKDLGVYRVNPDGKESDLTPDLFLDISGTKYE